MPETAEPEFPACDMTHTPPYDFAQCAQHDTTFPLGGACKFSGRDPFEVLYEEVDQLRARAVRAELELERAQATVAEMELERSSTFVAQFIRQGVCLLCGDGVLSNGEHIQPERHAAEVERITSGAVLARPAAPDPECGGCEGKGSHRFACTSNPRYSRAGVLAKEAEDLGDRIGANNMGAANHCYRAAGILRDPTPRPTPVALET